MNGLKGWVKQIRYVFPHSPDLHPAHRFLAVGSAGVSASGHPRVHHSVAFSLEALQSASQHS